MTVDRLYKNMAFEPETISVMTSALADVCRTLGLSERNEPDVNKVAKTVIEYAQRGRSVKLGPAPWTQRFECTVASPAA